LLASINDEKALETAIKSVISKIDTIRPNLENNDLSKSRDFVKSCLDTYH
jgi:hypothetical protein